MSLEVNSLRVHRAPTCLVVKHEEKTQEEAVSAYGYTYKKLFEEFLQQGPREAARFNRYCLNKWLFYNQTEVGSPVGTELSTCFEDTLTAFCNALGTKVADKTVRNIRGRIKALEGFYVSLLEKEEIPSGFLEALRFGLVRMGLKPGQLIHLVGTTAYSWATEKSSPDYHNNKRCGSTMQRLEEVLHFPPGMLASRAWPDDNMVAKLNDDIPFRRYSKLIQRYKYRLNVELMPNWLQEDIGSYFEHKQQQSHLLATGEVITLPLTQVWCSSATPLSVQVSLEFFFGFLRLPKTTGPQRWPESLKFGLGIPENELCFTMLVQKELLFQYMLYAEQRSFDQLHFADYEEGLEAQKKGLSLPTPSGASLRKTLPSSTLLFIALCINLVNKPTGYLRMHPDFGLELPKPVAAEEWEAWCLERCKEMRALAKAARAKVKYNKRSNKEVLAEVLRKDDPRETLFLLADAMKKNMPPDTAELWQAVHWRNLTMVSLLTFECIRAKNVWMLDIGRHLTIQEGKYRLFIPKHEMKNVSHGHAEDIERIFPDDLQELLHTWLTVYRPQFRGHDKTKALFVRADYGPKPKGRADFYRLNTARVSETIAQLTKKYLGLAFRSHGFRYVNVTSVVKQGGTIYQVKAVLNDSHKTAMKFYVAVNNADQREKLDDFYEQTRARVK